MHTASSNFVHLTVTTLLLNINTKILLLNINNANQILLELYCKTDFVLIHPFTNFQNVFNIHTTVALHRCTPNCM